MALALEGSAAAGGVAGARVRMRCGRARAAALQPPLPLQPLRRCCAARTRATCRAAPRCGGDAGDADGARGAKRRPAWAAPRLPPALERAREVRHTRAPAWRLRHLLQKQRSMRVFAALVPHGRCSPRAAHLP
jgi:hypothetical protein